MDIEKIETLVKQHIIHSVDGADKEHLSFDFKRKWYDLKSKAGISEFLKDATSFANAITNDCYIVIGFDERKGEFYDAVFSNSGLKDSNELGPILEKRLSHPFDVNSYDIILKIKGEDRKLSVLHIPTTYDFPYFIRNHQTLDKKGEIKNHKQRVFVRKNTSMYEASKTDFDRMYEIKLEKKIEKDFDYEIEIISHRIVESFNHYFEVILIINNRGNKPFALTDFKLQYNSVSNVEYTIKKSTWSLEGTALSNSSIIIPNNTISEINLSFPFPNSSDEEVKKFVGFFKGFLYSINLKVFFNKNRSQIIEIESFDKNKLFASNLLNNRHKLEIDGVL